jgi:hypothetical protein
MRRPAKLRHLVDERAEPWPVPEDVVGLTQQVASGRRIRPEATATLAICSRPRTASHGIAYVQTAGHASRRRADGRLLEIAAMHREPRGRREGQDRHDVVVHALLIDRCQSRLELFRSVRPVLAIHGQERELGSPEHNRVGIP